jgi:DmsE family decaheme c-type cytochrome
MSTLRVATGLLLMLAAWPSPAAAQTPAPTSPVTPSQAEYVGSEVCQACHQDIYDAFQKNPHQLLETDQKRGWATKACESCHGPGSKHAESTSPADIRQPAKLRPSETDRVCLACHLNQPAQVGRISSSHVRNQVSCTACHSIHKHGPYGLVPSAQPEINKLCASCHANIWASFQKPYRHRLPEGAMSCVDCHNPHGSPLPASIRLTRANEPSCANCHGDKVGPFPFEHAPVRLEGCRACHQPHGSANPRMLTRPQVQLLCMECHSVLPLGNPSANSNLGTVAPAFHDTRSARFQNCTVCHQKVHGSYVERALLK